MNNPEGDQAPYGLFCSELERLLLRKSVYYGNEKDGPLSNALSVEEFGIDPVMYQVIRIAEKIRRMSNLPSDENEARMETMKDIAGHCAVAWCIIRSKEHEPQCDPMATRKQRGPA